MKQDVGELFPTELEQLAELTMKTRRIGLLGLMAVAPLNEDPRRGVRKTSPHSP
ncbi:MAG: hypothetical protein WDO06_10155 [Actinomycetota bacterium]